jgi:hypothetical protein
LYQDWITDFCKKKDKLRNLFYANFSRCRLGEEGVVKLAEGISGFRIRVLILDRNLGKDRGAVALSRALK